MKTFFFLAGEASGDLHGANLISELKKAEADIQLHGVAGPEMRKQGVKGQLKMEDFQVMGFSDVIKELPNLIKKFYLLRDQILALNPSAVVFIDYPDFNLRLAKELKKKGYQGKLIHFICPSVWAWRKNRIPFMSRHLDHLLTIYPFEPKYFEGSGLSVDYIGNPLVETLDSHNFNPDWKKMVGLPDDDAPLFAIFPGSRPKEIERNLDRQLDAVEIIRSHLPEAKFALSLTSTKLHAQITPLLAERGIVLNKDLWLVPHTFKYELMKDSSTAIAKSGTVTLELALLKKPTVVMYGLSRLNKFIAKHILRLNLPYFCIVNILAGKEVFPELIKEGFNAETIAKKALELELNDSKRAECHDECEKISQFLGTHSPSQKGARIILDTLCQKN